VRAFVFKSKREGNCLEVSIFEGGDEVGVTCTAENKLSALDAIQMAEEWIKLEYGLCDDEFTLV
jgi:hypothetical protein